MAGTEEQFDEAAWIRSQIIVVQCLLLGMLVSGWMDAGLGVLMFGLLLLPTITALFVNIIETYSLSER